MNKKLKTGAALTAVGAAAAVNMIRAACFVPPKKESAKLEDERVNIERYTKNLSDAIKIKTISNLDESLVDWSRFDELHKLFEERYPLVYKTLTVENVGKASLLFTWQGKNPNLDPIALLGHQDVVPISEGTEKDWEHDPFGGEIADGYLWGRGALDMKNHLIGVLESVETLIEDGFEPERTVLLCFGHNEEIVASPDSGAKQISQLLESRGVKLDSVLDEGGAILPVKVPGVIDKNLAGIGIAEKGYCDFEVSISAKGGHSSDPPKHTALGQLADVIKDVENNQFKSEITPLVDDLIDKIGRNSSFLARNIFCNVPVLKPVIKKILSSIPASASFVRTTTAVTMAQGSPQANVLPQKASATVNFRIMPGMTIADVEEHLHKVIRNKKAEIRLIGGNEPSNISPTNSRAFKAIEDICYSMNNNNVVAPYLVMGGTDARNYQNICDNVYRYSPFLMDMNLIFTTHGTNERIDISSFHDGIAFFKRYIKTLASC
ncbi:MAG: M20 family peptidase [Clostridiales bacterium]|nr:M20 family peptidase [Clostridiales bacterium]